MDSGLHSSLISSFLVATSVAALGTAFSLGSGYWLARIRSQARAEGLLLGIILPAIIPFLLFGFGFLSAMRYFDVAPSHLAVVIAHLVVFSPIGTALYFRRIRQLDVTIEYAARELGASAGRVLLEVIGGQVWRTGLSVGLAIFILSWDEFVISWFVSGVDKTYPVFIRGMLDSTMSPEIAAIGALTASISVVLSGLALRTAEFRRSQSV